MKRIITLLVLLNLITIWTLNAQIKKKDMPSLDDKIEQYRKNNYILREKLKEVLETQKRLKEIEREEIEKDPELKNLYTQIMNLRIQLWQNINEKLKDNEEYQRLKRRLKEIDEKIRNQLKERMEEKN
jgi:tetrahydromethanopterin S-methyltransferase subunit G